MSSRPEIGSLFRRLDAIAPAGYSAGLHIRFTAPLIGVTTYNPEWIEFYTSNAFVMRDPMVAWGFSNEGAKRWSEIELHDPFNIWGQGADFGLKFGVVVACGTIQSRTIVGAARSDREFEDGEVATIHDIVLALHEISEPPTELTPAQVQALRCIADGDRHAAAAAKLGISESALKARLVSARTRLLARTTTQAIQRAKEYRLL
ncbi:MAG: autoinducer binding domain-containing protein [Paracoccaceae bacterium]